MQNAGRISELIQKLWSTDERWETVVLNEEKSSGNGDVNKLIYSLHRVLRQELKTGDRTEVQEYLQKEKVNEEVAARLVDHALDLLEFYTAFSFLRELEENEIFLQGFLTMIYQKHIVRYEPEYFRGMKIGNHSSDELLDIISRIDALTDYYVNRCYTVKKMVSDLQDETGLSLNNCEYWAGLIEQNYQALKMDYILEKVVEIENRLDQWKAE